MIWSEFKCFCFTLNVLLFLFNWIAILFQFTILFRFLFNSDFLESSVHSVYVVHHLDRPALFYFTFFSTSFCLDIFVFVLNSPADYYFFFHSSLTNIFMNILLAVCWYVFWWMCLRCLLFGNCFVILFFWWIFSSVLKTVLYDFW